jgi:hypothetical protein
VLVSWAWAACVVDACVRVGVWACGAAARALLTTLRLRVVRESRQGREHRRAGVAVRQRGEGASAERSRELLEGARVIFSPL